MLADLPALTINKKLYCLSTSTWKKWLCCQEAEVQNRGSSVSTEKTYVLKKLKKKSLNAKVIGSR